MLKHSLIVAIAVGMLATPGAQCQVGSPGIYSRDGQFLGNLNANRFDPNSVANPYGVYGSRFSPNSVNNPFGTYGSQYSPEGAANQYGGPSSPVIYGSDGTYLGHLNANRFDPASVSDPYGQYGSQFSPTSVTNPYGTYGSQFSPSGAMNSFGMGMGPGGNFGEGLDEP